jgi:hypothetical protein
LEGSCYSARPAGWGRLKQGASILSRRAPRFLCSMTPNALAGVRRGSDRSRENECPGRPMPTTVRRRCRHALPDYPRVQVELNITNRNVDLIAEGFDLTIRLGQLPDSGLVGRKPEDAALLLVASPTTCIEEGNPSDAGGVAAPSVPAVYHAAYRSHCPGYFGMKGAILTGCRVNHRNIRRCTRRGFARGAGDGDLPEL